jgi:CheY-like chemotaxis protein/predicted alpha/beta hydrolase family esterase
MLKILVVDDSARRQELLKEAFQSSGYTSLLDVRYCDTADKARIEMLEYFDLLVLDVLIPKKVNGTPQALHSSRLLDDISDTNSEYIRPKLIIGLTADINELGQYRENFQRAASIVLDGSLHKLDWLETVLEQARILLRTIQKVERLSSDKLLISIHGIRTNGQWQRNLAEEIRKYSRSFDFIEIKYGFFDILSFAIPYLRTRKVKQIAKNLNRILKESQSKEITIVAHSFGTLILSEALKNKESEHPLSTVILCGSPLPHNHNIDHIIQRASRTINECGTRDIVLVAARVFMLGLGDAGRIGFIRENSERFINRYYRGGHSLYFSAPPNSVSFAEVNWLPSIISVEKPKYIDERSNYFGEDLVDITIKLGHIIKPFLYAGAAAVLILYPIYILAKN